MSIEKVQDFPHLAKDTQNGGVINTDKQGFQEYKRVQRSMMQKIQETECMKDELNNLRQEVSNMKSILEKLASR